MEPYLFFFDYDGTLVPAPDAEIPLRTRRALHALQAAGHFIALCTGRCRDHVPQPVKELGMDAYVMSCGAEIVIRGEQKYYAGIPEDTVMEYLRICRKYHRRGALEGQKRIPFFTPEYSEPGFPGIDCPEAFMREFAGVHIEKFTMYGVDIPEEMAAFFSAADLSVVRQSRYMEILRRGCDKGTGIRKTAEWMGIPLERTIGFGDSANDLAMLQTVGKSVVVGNAPEEIRALAHETTESVQEQGAALWIERLLEKSGEDPIG